MRRKADQIKSFLQLALPDRALWADVKHAVKLARTVLLTILVATPAWAAGPNDLPSIGSPAEAAISLDDEYRIGLSVLREYRNSDLIIEDPEVTQYIERVGHLLSSHAQEGNHRFQFVVIKDPSVNAFAVPGGFIFVHSGLVLATNNESELAGVLAHEISHVTQRHLVRSLLEQRKNSMASTAALLAAILLGATAGSGDAAIAGIAGAQTLALGQQMSFSRDMESEADRVGIGVLESAGFDPNGMSSFFEKIASISGGRENQLPSIVLSHPVTSERIAEARSRATQYIQEYGAPKVKDSVGYEITRERLRVLTTPAGENPLDYYQATSSKNRQQSDFHRYGRAIAMIASGKPSEAIPILKQLRARDETIVQYHTALAQAESLAGDGPAALATFEQAHRLFPRNVPVTVRYAEALMRMNQPKRAHELLLDLFNVVAPTPAQARQIAFAANAAGDVADAYSYMAEFHIMSGDLPLAINQLQLALAVPKISDVQRARFRARLDEIRAAMPRRMQRNNPDGGDRGYNVE